MKILNLLTFLSSVTGITLIQVTEPNMIYTILLGITGFFAAASFLRMEAGLKSIQRLEKQMVKVFVHLGLDTDDE